MSNRLANEESLYLRQHAKNPVDWFPWDKEAFEKAAKEDKPVFLSIGYSSCHWCHKMAAEAFSDEETAKILNENYISVKVDREERPDIDSVYMEVCQAVTGTGGWPLTVITTPERKPFFAGMYYPKDSAYNMYGLKDILKTVSEKWKTDRKPLKEFGEELIKRLKNMGNINAVSKEKIDIEYIQKAFEIFKKDFDPLYGGFGSAPKFPSPHNIMFLLAYYKYSNDPYALGMAEKTLEGIFRGGIFDHIGGGICRYSTDDRWLIPHFEKMLYDNALFAAACSEFYKISPESIFCHAAKKTVDYVLKELRAENGLFYASQDADSEGEEGGFYFISSNETEECLGKEEGKFFNKFFDITKKSVPNLIRNKDWMMAENEDIRNYTDKMYSFRKNRRALNTDKKIILFQNALAILSIARCGELLDESYYKESALRSLLEYEKIFEAKRRFLNDFAYTAWMYITLYEILNEKIYLNKAEELCLYIKEHFRDGERGGYFISSDMDEKLILSPKEVYDGAIPSGNSVMYYILEKLNLYSDRNVFKDMYEEQSSFLSAHIKNYPSGYAFALLGAVESLSH